MTDSTQPTASPTSRAAAQILAATSNARRSLVVPEWGDLELYFGMLTIADKNAARASYGEILKPSIEDLALAMIVAKAEDATGAKLFLPADAEALRQRASLSVINRVADFMYGVEAPTVAEAKEALTASPTSASVTS